MGSPLGKAVCPGCGWTGSPKSLNKYKSCPRCEYEGIESLSKILNSKGAWLAGKVDLGMFLRALEKLGLLKV